MFARSDARAFAHERPRARAPLAHPRHALLLAPPPPLVPRLPRLPQPAGEVQPGSSERLITITGSAAGVAEAKRLVQEVCASGGTLSAPGAAAPGAYGAYGAGAPIISSCARSRAA